MHASKRRLIPAAFPRQAKSFATGIWAYTHRHWSRAQADRYVGAIRTEIERLRDKPSLGRRVKNAQAPFLKRNSGSHVIFYLVADRVLDVVRVLHESMGFVVHLANDEK